MFSSLAHSTFVSLQRSPRAKQILLKLVSGITISHRNRHGETIVAELLNILPVSGNQHSFWRDPAPPMLQPSCSSTMLCQAQIPCPGAHHPNPQTLNPHLRTGAAQASP